MFAFCSTLDYLSLSHVFRSEEMLKNPIPPILTKRRRIEEKIKMIQPSYINQSLIIFDTSNILCIIYYNHVRSFLVHLVGQPCNEMLVIFQTVILCFGQPTLSRFQRLLVSIFLFLN